MPLIGMPAIIQTHLNTPGKILTAAAFCMGEYGRDHDLLRTRISFYLLIDQFAAVVTDLLVILIDSGKCRIITPAVCGIVKTGDYHVIGDKISQMVEFGSCGKRHYIVCTYKSIRKIFLINKFLDEFACRIVAPVSVAYILFFKFKAVFLKYCFGGLESGITVYMIGRSCQKDDTLYSVRLYKMCYQIAHAGLV